MNNRSVPVCFIRPILVFLAGMQVNQGRLQPPDQQEQARENGHNSPHNALYYV